MLKRIYIDNFRPLVDLQLSLDEITLFAGRSATGKSSVFEALRKMQAFIGGGQAQDLFKANDLAHFLNSPMQRFELILEGNGGLYHYELAIEHHQGDVQVANQRLWFNHKPLPSLESEEAAWFRERMKRFIIVQVDSPFMEAVSRQPEAELTPYMENFVSWYRYVSQKPSVADEITNALKEILEGLEYIRFAEAPQQEPVGRNSASQVLMTCFSGNGYTIEYGFHELADGERALIALYALLYYARSADVTLCIDHPTHFIALPTIKPWLKLLDGFCQEGELQAVLISHHPLLIDYLAFPKGYWFDRNYDDRPIRVRRFTDHETAGGPISEYVARDWISG